jgi:hypothetical protein
MIKAKKKSSSLHIISRLWRTIEFEQDRQRQKKTLNRPAAFPENCPPHPPLLRYLFAFPPLFLGVMIVVDAQSTPADRAPRVRFANNKHASNAAVKLWNPS